MSVGIYGSEMVARPHSPSGSDSSDEDSLGMMFFTLCGMMPIAIIASSSLSSVAQRSMISSVEVGGLRGVGTR